MQMRGPVDVFVEPALPHVADHEHWRWQKISYECPQDFVASDRQILHSTSDRIEHGVGDGRNCRYFTGFSDTLCAVRTVPIIALDEHHFDLGRVTVGHQSRAVESCSQRLSVSPVVNQVFVQRHADTHNGAAFDLAPCCKWIHDPSAIMHREILEDTHGAELSIHLDFDEMRAEGSAYFAVQRRIRRGRSDEYVFTRRQSFLDDLALECIGRLSHGVSSLACGAAARLPDGVWATVGIAHTTSTLDSGTFSASAAIMAMVVFAPAPISVTPTNTVYFPFASRRMTALLRPRADRNAIKETPAPRLIGPGSEPG